MSFKSFDQKIKDRFFIKLPTGETIVPNYWGKYFHLEQEESKKLLELAFDQYRKNTKTVMLMMIVVVGLFLFVPFAMHLSYSVLTQIEKAFEVLAILSSAILFKFVFNLYFNIYKITKTLRKVEDPAVLFFIRKEKVKTVLKVAVPLLLFIAVGEKVIDKGFDYFGKYSCQSGSAVACSEYAYSLNEQGKVQEAIEAAVKSCDKNYIFGCYNAACFHSVAGNEKESLRYLELTLKMGYKKWHKIDQDKDFNNVRRSPAFVDLIDQYKKASP